MRGHVQLLGGQINLQVTRLFIRAGGVNPGYLEICGSQFVTVGADDKGQRTRRRDGLIG